MNEVENTIPVLPVTDLRRSIQFYTRVLGFTLDWGGAADDGICSVSRDGHHIMLRQWVGTTTPSCVWIGLGSDLLFGEFRERGAIVVQEPENHPWGYDMKIQDPDGNILWLGTEPR